LKKPTSSVQFWFYKPKIEKIELNRTEPKQKNRAKPGKTKPKLSQAEKPRQTGLNQFFPKKPN